MSPLSKRLPYLLWATIALLPLARPATSTAQSTADFLRPGTPAPHVPPPLAPWVPWVLEGYENQRCAQLGNKPLCTWSSLTLDVNGERGRFVLQAQAEFPQALQLPGGPGHYPSHVTLDGKAVAVWAAPEPHLWLPAGSHRIAGELRWSRLPESITVPPHTGHLDLHVDGQATPHPRRDREGRIWLDGTTQDESAGQDRLELQVHRRLHDGSPLRITTRLTLLVSGPAREVILPAPLLQATQPIGIDSPLPARLEPNGSLRVQVVAGTHQVEIHSVAPQPLSQLKAPEHPSPWPQQELWVWVADPALRQVRLAGAPPVDPKGTALAADWHGLPTYRLGGGDTLQFDTSRRGIETPPPDALRLSRELYLDLDGNGFTGRDRITGTAQRSQRLDLVSGALGRVQLAGQEQLITQLDDQTGVELRTTEVDLIAEYRLKRDSTSLPAVGWSTDMDHVQATLHVPPGWALLSASGVDRADGTLLSRWDLWSFFFVLLVTLATAKLKGIRWGAIALFTLILCSHEPGAPEWVWLWLLSAVALGQLSQSQLSGQLVRLYLWLGVLAMTFVALPFAISQVRQALYPQLQEAASHQPLAQLATRGEPEADAAPPAPIPLIAESAAEEVAARTPLTESASAAGGAPGKSRLRSLSLPKQAQRKAAPPPPTPTEVVQTGPGVPTWQHQHYELRWSGPLHQGQTLDLQLIPPFVTRLLALLRVALLAGLLFGILRRNPLLKRPFAGLACLPVLLMFSSMYGPTVHAQSAGNAPPPEILEALSTRLRRPPACAPHCVTVTALQLQVAADQLTIEAEVHAAALGAYRLPGPISTWAPTEIALDGQAGSEHTRVENQALHIRIRPGVHLVRLTGPLPSSDTLTLHLGLLPQRVDFASDTWDIDGLRADGTPEQTVRLRRRVQRTQPTTPAQTLPTWLEVTRTLTFSTQFRVETQVQRLQGAQDTADALLRYPLLEGESVIQSDVETTATHALVRLAAGQTRTTFTSTLTPRATLQLRAPTTDPAANVPYGEQWVVRCGQHYHCTQAGLAPVARQSRGQVQATYQPYPGETLDLALTRLEGAPGSSTTIDAAELRWTPGARLTRAELHLSVRNSGGATTTITLPSETRLGNVRVDDRERPAQTQDGVLQLALQPGAHRVHVAFQHPNGIETYFKPPQVKVAGELVNVEVSLQVPEDRWLLWVQGPDWGPAVLFWGYLVSTLLLALLLARIPHSPLKAHQWALLALGLTQVGVGASLLVVGWFFALSLRGRHIPPGNLRFNGVQGLLLCLSLCAAAVLVEAVHHGLAVDPDMQVAGAGSHNTLLVWYLDRIRDVLPRPALVSVPMWIYRTLMLAWALWLAMSALKWLRWGHQQFAYGGRVRRPVRSSKHAQAETPPPSTTKPTTEPTPPTSS